MALADIFNGGQTRRLDSWKEIADYLGRDVRTATRWEAQGMPLHRVPGGKGTSVFAFAHEIDAWMAGREEGDPPPVAPPDVPVAAPDVPAAPLDQPAPPRRFGTASITALLMLALMAMGVAAVARLANSRLNRETLRATATQTQVYITDGSGSSRAIHDFKPGAQLIGMAGVRLDDLNEDGAPEVLVAVSNYNNLEDGSVHAGEVLALSTAGDMRWRFAFDDVLSFESRKFEGPWALVDLQVEPSASPALVAVAAHDFMWWGSLVAVLDQNGRRLGTFVNPGWVESLMWLDRARLAAGGFNNLRDEAMFALLDAGRADGQAPGGAGTPYGCAACPQTPPLFYATFARSELNRVTAGRFNRAHVSRLNDRILITTSETGPERSETNAIYEFDPDLRFLGARYSDRYWDEHRRLELEGRISHSRKDCPDANGPAAIHVWSGTEWKRTVASR